MNVNKSDKRNKKKENEEDRKEGTKTENDTESPKVGQKRKPERLK